MTTLSHASIAIDTNVFGHLTSKTLNNDKHINALLRYFINQKTSLLVDKDKKIETEYKHHLNNPELKKRYRKREEGYIMRYFMHPQRRKKVPVSKDALWNAIHHVIPKEDEEEDRTFVYVAFVTGSIVISNDKKHIVNRRDDLKAATKTMCSYEVDVMTSKTAHNQIPPTP